MSRLVRVLGWFQSKLERMRCHPAARRQLKDPFFWDGANNFAPHGNDTGSDLFHEYRRWLRQNPNGDAVYFLGELLRAWEVDDSSAWAAMVKDQAAIGLAFAEFKLRGRCGPEVKALAQAAVDRQKREAREATKWEFRDECLRSMERIEAAVALMK